MTTRMLIDAAHPEETRVVVVKGNRLDEFDFESSAKKQIKGNIYLARVTRIEPSLQAAFVEYGGNRHGFLAFNEIHPDYYQIPVADREALLAEEAEAVSIEDEPVDEDALEDALDIEAEVADAHVTDGSDRGEADSDAGNSVLAETTAGESANSSVIEAREDGNGDDRGDQDGNAGDGGSDVDGTPIAMSAGPIDSIRLEDQDAGTIDPTTDANGITADATSTDGSTLAQAADLETAAGETEAGEAEVEIDTTAKTEGVSLEASENSAETRDATVETESDEEIPDIDDHQKDEIGVTDVDDDTAYIRRRRRSRGRRNYRIQEVIKKRQVLLVQVVKEERGNKGAALTTYLSLAGRYCVLMPNTARGGGISRKITNPTIRRKLKGTLADLDVPKGMGVIVRTAGSERTKSEIKRDFDYLFRVWDTVRNLTISSQAPTVVYEEANLIKRAIRDLYTKEIDEVLVEGEEGYKLAKGFMRMLMPSHAKKVQPYRDQVPLFHRYQVHQQLDSMHSSVVTLRSGGYLVLNPTEALVSVDVNSGKSTRGKSIEETALKTNLEAAEELARQLRLRDLAGLVVIDFIDMDEHRNNRAVERRFKDCIKGDRARTQIGRISNFGLLEMSRQRLRPSLQEAISIVCPHCEGSGYMRSIESSVLHVLRAIEEEGIRSRAATIRAYVSAEVALQALNYKRQTLAEIEQRYQIEVMILADDKLISPNYRIELEGVRESTGAETEFVQVTAEPAEEHTDNGGRKRRRRGKKDNRGTPEATDNNTVEATTADAEPNADSDASSEDDKPKRRRRGRRGGRNRKTNKANENGQNESETQEDSGLEIVAAGVAEDAGLSETNNDIGAEREGAAQESTKKPRRRRSPRKPAAVKTDFSGADGSDADAPSPAINHEQTTAEVTAEVTAGTAPESALKINPDIQPEIKSETEAEPVREAEPAKQAESKRKGWWQRAIGR